MADKEEKWVSKEEYMFAEWLREAQEAGLVESWEEQPVTWELIPKQTLQMKKKLKTKTKTVDRHLCQAHTYTPDFLIHMTKKGEKALDDVFKLSLYTKDYKKNRRVYVDTKGGYTIQNSQVQIFSANRKLVHYFYNIWVCKIVPWYTGKCLFKQTWCPEKFRYKNNVSTPTLTKKGEICGTIDQFLNEVNRQVS